VRSAPLPRGQAAAALAAAAVAPTAILSLPRPPAQFRIDVETLHVPDDAGGLSNAFPELVNDGGVGGRFDLRAIPNAEPGMSPLEVWSNEAQERYVLAVGEVRLAAIPSAVQSWVMPALAQLRRSHPLVRLVVSDPRRALDIFEERGTLVVESEVLVVENRNHPGALSKIAKALAKKKINIEYAYLASHPGDVRGLLILRVDRAKPAWAALKALKI
jgi:hypothetical protein